MDIKNLFLTCILFLIFFSCGQHNKAPSKGLNYDSKRIYGIRNGDPLQLNTSYPEDKNAIDRMAKLRDKMFPK